MVAKNKKLADALKVIADAIVDTTTETKEVKKNEPGIVFAVYRELNYAPVNHLTGAYVIGEDAQEAYYNLYPQYRPVAKKGKKSWDLAKAGAAIYTVPVESDEKAAKEKVTSALSGLRILDEQQGRNNGYDYKYHVVRIEEISA